MATETSFDLIVIGGGPGGYVAAIRAAQLGGKIALVEREHLGGICLNWGCIPTKALLRTAEVAHLIRRADEFGLKAELTGIDLKKVVARSRAVAARLTKGVSGLMKKNKITVIDGEARLDGMAAGGLRKLAVTGAERKALDGLTAKHVILATGARARTLPGLEPNGKTIVTYKDAMVPETMPSKLLVVGSGAIGMEFASFYSDLGAAVTVVEVLDRILPVEDADISAFAAKAFESQGMKLMTSAKVDSLKSARGKVTAKIAPAGNGKAETLVFDRVLPAIAITGTVENPGLAGPGEQLPARPIPPVNWRATAEHAACAAPWARRGTWAGRRRCPRVQLWRGAGGQGRPDRGRGQGTGPCGESRALSRHGQRQGDCTRRGRGPGQDRVRREHRRASGGASDRRRGDGTDPGLCPRPDAGDHRGRVDANRFPPSDAVGNDARIDPRRLRPGDSHVIGSWPR